MIAAAGSGGIGRKPLVLLSLSRGECLVTWNQTEKQGWTFSTGSIVGLLSRSCDWDHLWRAGGGKWSDKECQQFRKNATINRNVQL